MIRFLSIFIAFSLVFTQEDSDHVVWHFDISAEMVTMTGDHIIDQFNRIGFYYSTQEEAALAGLEAMDQQREHYETMNRIKELEVKQLFVYLMP